MANDEYKAWPVDPPEMMPLHSPEHQAQVCKFLKKEPEEYDAVRFNHNMCLWKQFERDLQRLDKRPKSRPE